MKICFVTSEIVGLTKNGGIGTATTSWALAAARLGHEVEIAFFNYNLPKPEDEAAAIEYFAKHPAGSIALTVCKPLVGRVEPDTMARAKSVHEFLKTKTFDKIVFQDYLGPGYCCFVSKRLGLGFADTELVYVAHSPREWCSQANLSRLDVNGMVLSHMEMECYRHADAVFSPSQHMMDWMESHWGHTDAHRQVMALYFEFDSADPANSEPVAATAEPEPLREICFFGRLERRKGIEVFVEALREIDPELLKDIAVTFLGKPDNYTPAKIEGLYRRGAVVPPCPLQFLSNYDQPQALAYLKKPGVLCVMPSLIDNSPCVIYECLQNHIAFLASNAGGCGELVHHEDAAQVLFEPKAPSLAALLANILRSGHLPPRARPAEHVLRATAEWEAFLNARYSRIHEPAPYRPKVSIVITTHDRPKLLKQAIESVETWITPISKQSLSTTAA